MSLYKRHYDQIARAFAAELANPELDEHARNALARIATALADQIHITQNNFDYDRFLSACGLRNLV